MAHKTTYSFLKKKVLVAAAALAGMTSWMACTQFDLAKPEIQANPEFGVAIGRFSFLFSDFIKGDSLLKVGVDSSIALKYVKDSIVGYSVADIVNRATGGIGSTITNSTTLGAVSVPALNMTQATTLSQFGAAFSPPLSTFCTTPTTLPFVTPAFTSSTAITNNLAPLTDYQTITLATGDISIQLTNNFPFPIDSVTVEIINTATAEVVAAISVVNQANRVAGIAARGGVGSGSKSLAGKTMSNQLSYRIGTFRSAGMPANTTSDPNATMAVVVTTSNMKISSGNVKVTAQSLAGETILASVATSNADQKLVEISLRGGTITGNITKTTPVQLSLAMKFPSIQKLVAGVWQPFPDVMIQLTGGAGSSAPININFADTRLRLDSVAAQRYNKLPISIATSVIASTGFIAIDQSQQVNVNATFSNIQIGGAVGQFGTFDIAVPPTNQDFGADFGFLSNQSKGLFFASPSLKIKMLNSFGLTINTDLAMEATGFLPGTEKLLLKSGGGNIAFTIPRFPIAQIGQLASGTFLVDTATTTIQKFMSILPKVIASSGKVSISSLGLVPGSAANMDYFTYDSRIKLGLEMDIPLKFSAENLIVRDTITTFKNRLKKEQVQYVDTVLLDIQYKTRLPLGVTVDLATLLNGVPTTVVRDILLPAADAIDANGKVTAQKVGTFTVPMTAAQLSQLSDAPEVVLVAKIQTAKGGFTPVAMYTHYDFDMGIGLRIKTKIIK